MKQKRRLRRRVRLRSTVIFLSCWVYFFCFKDGDNVTLPEGATLRKHFREAIVRGILYFIYFFICQVGVFFYYFFIYFILLHLFCDF